MNRRTEPEQPSFEFAITAELKKLSFLQAQPPSASSKYIHKFQREKDLFIALSIVYIQISNTYLPEFLNMLL